MENSNKTVETVTVEEPGFFAKATGWLKQNWGYVVGGVVVAGGAYGAYRYFGGEKAEASAPQLENGVDRTAL